MLTREELEIALLEAFTRSGTRAIEAGTEGVWVSGSTEAGVGFAVFVALGAHSVEQLLHAVRSMPNHPEGEPGILIERGRGAAMRHRGLLHKAKLEAFATWAERNGCRREQPKGDEVLRLRDDRGALVCFHARRDAEHVTAFDAGLELVRRYLFEGAPK